MSYATGAPEYNPYRYSTERALLHNEVDAVMWISSFGAKINLPQTTAPIILLSDMILLGQLINIKKYTRLVLKN